MDYCQRRCCAAAPGSGTQQVPGTRVTCGAIGNWRRRRIIEDSGSRRSALSLCESVAASPVLAEALPWEPTLSHLPMAAFTRPLTEAEPYEQAVSDRLESLAE